jgi:hypothetical protein
MRRIVKLTSLGNVGPGLTATLDLPTGRRYFAVGLKYKTNAIQSVIETDVTEIRVVVNGKVQWRLSAADLNVLNAVRNRFAFRAGLIPLFFAQARRRTWEGEEGLAWGTIGVQTFRIEVDIAAGATAPTLSATADIDDVPAPLGPIVKIYKETFNAAGAQTLNITTLPKRDAYAAIHARSALVTAMKATVDSLEIAEVNAAENGDYLARRDIVVPANNFSLVFDQSDQVTDALPMQRAVNGQLVPVNEFRLDVTASGAGSIPLLIERVGSPD